MTQRVWRRGNRRLGHSHGSSRPQAHALGPTEELAGSTEFVARRCLRCHRYRNPLRAAEATAIPVCRTSVDRCTQRRSQPKRVARGLSRRTRLRAVAEGPCSRIAPDNRNPRDRKLASESRRFVFMRRTSSHLLESISFLPEALVRHRIGDIFPLIGSPIQHS